MEPRNEQYGSRSGPPDGGDLRGFDRTGRDPFDDRGDEWGAPSTAQVTVAAPRARTGLLLVIAFALEFLIIVGAGNQWVSDKIARLNPATFMGLGLRNVALVYEWRFTPRAHDTEHLWLGSLALIVTTFVLSLLLIAAVIRGPVGFGRAFLGTWMAVAVATMIGGYVRGLVVDFSSVRGQGSRAEMALFGITSPGSIYFLAGLGLGFVVAVVLGIVAPLTRRGPQPSGPAGGPPAAEPGTGPWQDQFYGPPPRRGAFEGRDEPGPGTDETTQLPSLRKDESPRQDDPSAGTSRLPSFDAPPTAWSQAPARAREDEPNTGSDAPPAATAGERGHPDEQETGALPVPPAGKPEEQPTTALPVQSGAHPDDRAAAGGPAAQPTAGEPAGASAAGPDQPEPEPAAHEQHTQAMPVQQAPEAQAEPPEQPDAPGAAAGETAAGPATMQFPRPPDDEDLDPEVR